MKEEGFSGCWEGEVLEGNLLMRKLLEGDLLPINETPAVNLLEAGGCGELRGELAWNSHVSQRRHMG